jgi:hypothetical protein
VYYLCTYFDHRYLPRGLALYWSIRRYFSSFELWVLCMDDTCYDALSRMGLPHVRLIALQDLEAYDPELLNAKKNRSRIEYYFTCTPSLPLYILENRPEADHIVYLDADVFFFSDPVPMYDEIDDSSIAIVAHRFPPELHALEAMGLYNVGWLFFKRDRNSESCLRWWRERCIEWCYDWREADRYADQKYLDQWPDLFPGVIALRHKGANLAPWNIANYRIRADGRGVWVDDQPLVFFHFHLLRKITGWMYHTNLRHYGVGASRTIRGRVYGPYVRALSRATRHASHFLGRSSVPGMVAQPLRDVHPEGRATKWLKRAKRLCRAILRGQCVFAWNGHVL